MKTVFVAFALCLSSVSYAAGTAFVNTAALGRPHTVLTAALTTFNIDARESFAHADAGSVTVDTQSREISISFAFRPVCNPGQLCPQFIENLGSITLPLVSAQADTCGSVTYTASRDLMTVDGGSQAIVVVDNSHFRCETLQALIPTEVTVREIPARGTFTEERVSSFMAAPLQTTVSQSVFAR
jgi:hypothetical protein